MLKWGYPLFGNLRIYIYIIWQNHVFAFHLSSEIRAPSFDGRGSGSFSMGNVSAFSVAFSSRDIYGGFRKNRGTPHSWMVFVRENPNLEMDDDFGVYPYFRKPRFLLMSTASNIRNARYE